MSGQLRRLAALVGLILTFAPPAGAAEPFSFGVFGDTPYNGFERRQLPALIAEMNAEPLRFVVHDGDVKSGGERCDDAVYEERLAVFQESHHPFVFVPGDNDWTDCHRASNGGFVPLERLARLRQLFFAEPHRSLGRNTMAVETQADDPIFNGWPEHLRWQIGPVLFVTLNVPGSNNNFGRTSTPSDEFVRRSAAVRAWLGAAFARARAQGLEGVVIIQQGNPDLEDFSAGRPSRGYRALLEQLLVEMRTFSGEVVLVHGDSHVHRIDHPLRDPATDLPVEALTRVETFGSPFMGWVRIDVEPGRRPLFRYQSRHYSPVRSN